MITISFKAPSDFNATVSETTMVIENEDATRDELMHAFQQFLSGIGYVFTVEELDEFS